MSTAVAPERQFVTYRRGEIREDILASWRVHLRTLTNPDTGIAFTEVEIATATASHSRYWIEADAIDLALLGSQNNSLYMADQVRVTRASTAWLENFHGVQWDEPRLGATGGSGTVTQRANPGTIFVGSTTIPDATAYVMTAPDGKRFQNLYTTVAPIPPDPGDNVSLVLKGIDTGTETNVLLGTHFTPAENIPPGVSTEATAAANFTGGIPTETDAQWAQRIADIIRHRPASGNSSHVRTFARRSTVAVEDAFVYACALHAGTTVVCVTQKRGGAAGPWARIPSTSTLATAIAYLTPPGSPVVPSPPFFMVVPPDDVTDDVMCSLSMPTGRDAGWADDTPWPNVNGSLATTVTGVISQVDLTITRPTGTADLPTGVTAPSLMAWDVNTSRFEKLDVTWVGPAGGDDFSVNLGTAPVMSITTGTIICPDTALREIIGETAEAYFDTLGPGQVIDLASDIRSHRAYRFPTPDEVYPLRAGTSILTYLHDALGAVLADSVLDDISVSLPTVPADPSLGPRMLILNKLGVYAL